MIRKYLKRKNIQVIPLSVLFLPVAVTGLVPCFIDWSGSTNILKFIFMETHDKLARFLVVSLILHVCRSKKWFAHAYAKFKG
jgi:hypothetical protein